MPDQIQPQSESDMSLVQLQQLIESQTQVISAMKAEMETMQISISACEASMGTALPVADIVDTVKSVLEKEFQPLLKDNINDVSELVKQDLAEEGNFLLIKSSFLNVYTRQLVDPGWHHSGQTGYGGTEGDGNQV